MTSRLYKGSTILGLANKGAMLTEKISAKKACVSIKKKFGKIEREAEYYHRANNVWSMYDRTKDGRTMAKKTGKRYTMSRKHMGDSGKKYDEGYL